MRHVVCVLLGHLFEEPTTILGFTHAPLLALREDGAERLS